MSLSTKKDRSDQLGESFGAARNRLHRNLLYHLATRLDMLSCYKCKQHIDTVEVFTIEHMKPWQRQEDPIKAFFDLSNIAFSHARCNRPTTRTHCEKGHPFFGDNLVIHTLKSGSKVRKCKICLRASKKKFIEKNPHYNERDFRRFMGWCDEQSGGRGPSRTDTSVISEM